MIKCDFFVYCGECSASPYRSKDTDWHNFSGNHACEDATRNFTNFMIERERNRNSRTFNKNVNINKNQKKKSYNRNR